jgi:hypothetical protein
MDIDLIPTDYRAKLWQLRWLKGCGTTLATMLLATALAYVGLTALAQVADTQLSTLELRRDVTAQQQTFVQQLTSEKEELERQWKLLNDLKRGTDAVAIFRAVDRAFIDDSLWFDEWEFNRQGVPATNGPGQSPHAVLIPSPGAGSQMRLIETHMNMRGEAIDHVALSNFVRRLLAQPEIADVKVRRTSRRQIRDARVIAFDLAVLVEPLENKHGLLSAF